MVSGKNSVVGISLLSLILLSGCAKTSAQTTSINIQNSVRNEIIAPTQMYIGPNAVSSSSINGSPYADDVSGNGNNVYADFTIDGQNIAADIFPKTESGFPVLSKNTGSGTTPLITSVASGKFPAGFVVPDLQPHTCTTQSLLNMFGPDQLTCGDELTIVPGLLEGNCPMTACIMKFGTDTKNQFGGPLNF